LDIKFENKFSSKTALLLVCFNGKQILNTNILSEATGKLVKDFISKNKNKQNIISIGKKSKKIKIKAKEKTFYCDKLISTIPLNDFCNLYIKIF